MLLFIHPHFTYPGGAGKFVLEVANRLAQKGMDLGVVTLSVDNDIVKPYRHVKFFTVEGSLPNTISHWLTFPKLMRRISDIISELKAEVLFPQTFPANYWGLIYKKQHRDISCIWYCHEPSAFVHNLHIIRGLMGPIKYAALISNPIFQILDRRLAKNADRIIVNSQYTASQVKSIYHLGAEIIYPGVDVESFQPSKEKENFIFTIGRLTRFKRIDLILKALVVLKKEKGKQPPLVIGGDGEQKDALIRLAQETGLSSQVYFVGRLSHEEVVAYLSRAKTVIFPTTNEPFGFVPLEAMACGTPVIAGNSGGPRETIVDGETGLLFEPDNEHDLALKIDTLLSDKDLHAKMCAAARKHVVENFSWERTVDSLYGILTQT